ncbi:hypothetical protein OM416_20165 [Paenibacillus sp. LS1]|uniref:hypothetical protein n=1 Tax=Paenibacillus sp. LS1 TaxID=2992120 RepID=UPI002232B70B|nr:hypothetical protein [Paenibacillus sp. LS1]MCW3793912.1 hypothetical protein [Paenibacillus sp. LS1]
MNINNDPLMKPMILEIVEHLRLHQRTITEEDVVHAAVKTMRDMIRKHGAQCEPLFFDSSPVH